MCQGSCLDEIQVNNNIGCNSHNTLYIYIHNNTIGLDLCFEQNTSFFLHPSFRIFYDSICYSSSDISFVGFASKGWKFFKRCTSNFT